MMITYSPLVCSKAVVEQTALLHPLTYCQDNTLLQDVVLYIAIRTVEEKVKKQRKTDWLVRGSSYSEIMTQNIRRKEPDGGFT